MDELLGDRSAKASAAVATRRRIIGLDELLEDPTTRAFADSDARVSHLETESKGVISFRGQRDADVDATALRKLDSVCQEIEQHLTQMVRVAAKMIVDCGIDHRRQRESLGLGMRPKKVH